MHDPRLPRHDRPPETWLPHPGTLETPPPPPLLLGDTQPFHYAPAPRPMGPSMASSAAPDMARAQGASARFLHGTLMGRKSIPLAAGLALLGPLGLFYVSLLNGAAALLIVPYAVRALAFAAAQAVGGDMQTVTVLAAPICWCITVPWSIIAARRRNARRGF